MDYDDELRRHQEIFRRAWGIQPGEHVLDIGCGGGQTTLAVSGIQHPRGAWVEAVNPATWSEELLVRLHREVLLLSDVRGMLSVASGRIDALVIAGLTMGYEDIAPIPLLITEAGGRVSDLDGNVLASNGHIHDALLDLVRGVPSGRDYQALIKARG